MVEGNTKESYKHSVKQHPGKTFKVYVLDFNTSEDMLGKFLTSISKLGADMEVVDINTVIGLGLRIIVCYLPDKES
jgi:hypothetical protein